MNLPVRITIKDNSGKMVMSILGPQNIDRYHFLISESRRDISLPAIT